MWGFLLVGLGVGAYALWEKYHPMGIMLTQGKKYAVEFTTPPGQPIALGTTGWMPDPNTVSNEGTSYKMHATWNGPTDRFYLVNPVVAGPNKVTSIQAL